MADRVKGSVPDTLVSLHHFPPLLVCISLWLAPTRHGACNPAAAPRQLSSRPLHPSPDVQSCRSVSPRVQCNALQVRWIVTAPWPPYVTTFGLFHMMGWLFMGMRVLVYLKAADYVHLPIFFAFFNTGILSGIGAVGYASLTPEYGSGKNHNKVRRGCRGVLIDLSPENEIGVYHNFNETNCETVSLKGLTA